MCRSPPTKEATTSLWAGPSAHGRGIKADVRRRRPWYVSDWTDGWNAKTTASLFYMFFTSIAPAITFADLLDSATKGKIGVVEVCLSSCVSGVIFSVFAGQPLVIVGVTGPVMILTITIYQLAEALDVNFLYFYSWAQIFAGAMHMLVAVLGWCDFIRYITNFSCHTFGLLIATIYAWTGIRSIYHYYTRSGPFDVALLQTIIALGCTLVALVPVRKSTSASGAPDNSPRSHFAAMTRPCWLRSGGEEPASPRHRAGVASMAWRSTRLFRTNAP